MAVVCSVRSALLVTMYWVVVTCTTLFNHHQSEYSCERHLHRDLIEVGELLSVVVTDFHSIVYLLIAGKGSVKAQRLADNPCCSIR